MHDVYLLLGSNIEPEKNISLAIRSLMDSTQLMVKRISAVWQTKAIGSSGADFLNVAVHIRITCELGCLKEMVIGEIEKKLGRVRTGDKYAPRTIDLDVIVFDHIVIDKDVFQLDHIMLPISELLPELFSDEYQCTLIDLSRERKKHTLAKKRFLSLGTIK